MTYLSVQMPHDSKTGIYTYSTLTGGPKSPCAFNTHSICPFTKHRFNTHIDQSALRDYPLALIKWKSTGIARFVDGNALFKQATAFQGNIKNLMHTKGYSSINLFKLYKKGHGLLHIAKYKLQRDTKTSEISVQAIAVDSLYKLETIPFAFITEQTIPYEIIHDIATSLITFRDEMNQLAKTAKEFWKSLIAAAKYAKKALSNEKIAHTNLAMISNASSSGIYPKVPLKKKQSSTVQPQYSTLTTPIMPRSVLVSGAGICNSSILARPDTSSVATTQSFIPTPAVMPEYLSKNIFDSYFTVVTHPHKDDLPISASMSTLLKITPIQTTDRRFRNNISISSQKRISMQKIKFSDQQDIEHIVNYITFCSTEGEEKKVTPVNRLIQKLKKLMSIPSFRKEDGFENYLLYQCEKMTTVAIAHYVRLLYFMYKDLKMTQLTHTYFNFSFFEKTAPDSKEDTNILRVIETVISNCKLLHKMEHIEDALFRTKTAYLIEPKFTLNLVKNSPLMNAILIDEEK